MNHSQVTPTYLQPMTRKWFAQVVADYELEPHHIKLLTLAAESWDRGVEARQKRATEGLTFTGKFGAPRIPPPCSFSASRPFSARE